MNIVDIVILGIIGVSILIGMYRGFITSVASLGGTLLSIGLSFWLGPKLVGWVQSNPETIRTLVSFTGAQTRIGDQALAQTDVAALAPERIQEVLQRVSLPQPLSRLLQNNLENQSFAPYQIRQVGDYVSQTIIGAVLNVISFVICFILCMIVLHFVLNLLKAVFKFPVLKQMNSLAGGIFGLLRGVLICYVAFVLLPLVQTAVPMEGLDELLAASALSPVFQSDRLILAIMNGRL